MYDSHYVGEKLYMLLADIVISLGEVSDSAAEPLKILITMNRAITSINHN